MVRSIEGSNEYHLCGNNKSSGAMDCAFTQSRMGSGIKSRGGGRWAVTRRYSQDSDESINTAMLARIEDLQREFNRLSRRVTILEEHPHGGRIGFCGECGGSLYRDGRAVHGENCSRTPAERNGR